MILETTGDNWRQLEYAGVSWSIETIGDNCSGVLNGLQSHGVVKRSLQNVGSQFFGFSCCQGVFYSLVVWVYHVGLTVVFSHCILVLQFSSDNVG